MKILHISNFVQKQKGRLYWNHCFKINNGFIRNGHNLCLFSDRDISRMNKLNKLNNNRSLNKELLATFKNFDPDVVVIGHADKIHNETLNEFRSIKKDIKIIEWNVDNYLLDNTEKKFKLRSHLIDAFFIYLPLYSLPEWGIVIINGESINHSFSLFKGQKIKCFYVFQKINH